MKLNGIKREHLLFSGVVVLIALCGWLATTRVTSRTSAEANDLSNSELEELKKTSLRTAWRICAYYSFAKNDRAKALKWEKIAREIESMKNDDSIIIEK